MFYMKEMAVPTGFKKVQGTSVAKDFGYSGSFDYEYKGYLIQQTGNRWTVFKNNEPIKKLDRLEWVKDYIDGNW